MSSLLKLESVSAAYGESEVLWDIDLEAPEGAVTALVGSNGAGKTSLMRVVSGLLIPTSGKVAFAGKDITGLVAERRVVEGIALVPEGRRLFAGLSILENLMLGAFTRRDDRVKEDLERVWKHFPELADRSGQIAGTLSGGQQQMCAIGRALMARPKLLLVDEMSLGLAPVVVDRLAEALLDVNESDGLTIILVEQDVELALEIASRGYVLDTGRVVMSGEAGELRDNPKIREAYMGVAA
ncbi:ABC transporter ATP-binding protein [Afifella sp. IM 167]|uniref:ABC transporter ATP-binding protein n=1 Tax=Afifella sp. IM 167 TaxID=2033586 RepID=UPI001CCF0391|nr:ABC transporter ATP-binding protein [Afifella sp. IM 167]MBZ8134480.1 branched-chain amino acid ABC transporter ATP-binding protein [Afifella sp. IM 167]